MPAKDVDIGAILAAAYRRPETELDAVANKVRARLALMDTLGECMRLLIEVPGSAVSASLSRPIGEQEEEEQREATDDDE